MAVNPDDYPLERVTNKPGRAMNVYRCVRCTDNPDTAGDPYEVLDPDDHEARVHAGEE
jgi:hypothetical protein